MGKIRAKGLTAKAIRSRKKAEIPRSTAWTYGMSCRCRSLYRATTRAAKRDWSHSHSKMEPSRDPQRPAILYRVRLPRVLLLATYRRLKSLVTRAYSRRKMATVTRQKWASTALRELASQSSLPARAPVTEAATPYSVTPSAKNRVKPPRVEIMACSLS
jgi:hypothetical protein